VDPEPGNAIQEKSSVRAGIATVEREHADEFWQARRQYGAELTDKRL
jgi:hypothetical protein